MVVDKVGQGDSFLYVFDLGDEWVSRCEVIEAGVDPMEQFGDRPKVPVPLFGWGWIPDQYGRLEPENDDESEGFPLPSVEEDHGPRLADLDPE
jgi:hypothetical protein